MRHLASSPMQVVPSLHPAEILLLLAYGVANLGKFPAQYKVLVAVVVVWRKVVARFMNRYTYIYGRSVNKVKNKQVPSHPSHDTLARERERETSYDSSTPLPPSYKAEHNAYIRSVERLLKVHPHIHDLVL